MLAELSRSVIVTAPKAEILEDIEVVRRSADTIRPIAPMQSGSRLVALRKNAYVVSAVAETIAPPQKRVHLGLR